MDFSISAVRIDLILDKIKILPYSIMCMNFIVYSYFFHFFVCFNFFTFNFNFFKTETDVSVHSRGSLAEVHSSTNYTQYKYITHITHTIALHELNSYRSHCFTFRNQTKYACDSSLFCYPAVSTDSLPLCCYSIRSF